MMAVLSPCAVSDGVFKTRIEKLAILLWPSLRQDYGTHFD